MSALCLAELSVCAVFVIAGHVAPLLRSIRGSGEFDVQWARIAYLTTIAASSALLLVGILGGILLSLKARARGGSLGVPGWSVRASAVCATCCAGFLCAVAAQSIWVTVLLQNGTNGWSIGFAAIALAMIVMLASYSGWLAVAAVKGDEGDVVEFENKAQRGGSSSRKTAKKKTQGVEFCGRSGEDDGEVENLGSLQY